MKYTSHFAEKSEDYLRFRPEYPHALFDYLKQLTEEHELAWDAGTGNGQAAVKLAEFFNNVVGSDINQAQLDVAMKRNNIYYVCSPVEKTNIPHASVDLIVVAQALHWFDLEKFYREVNRVAKPNAKIAAWCYSLGNVDAEIDQHIMKLYGDILGDAYWPQQRKYVDAAYQTIPFPFQKITAPVLQMEKTINFFELIGYLQTWSAVKEYVARNAKSPVDLIYADLQKAWGNPIDERVIRWPIHMLVGKVR